MSRVYFYKLTADNGGAPCMQGGLLSLAICKPMIRSTAEAGDLIFGFAANSLHSDNRLIYIAVVMERVQNGGYYAQSGFFGRADCIYERRGVRFVRRPGALHHRPDDLVHDLGEFPGYPKANVLLSSDFRYFGANGTEEYKSKFPLVKDAVESLGRGHRVWHDEQLWMELLALKHYVWKQTKRKATGKPTSAPKHGASHRSRSCGVLSAPSAPDPVRCSRPVA